MGASILAVELACDVLLPRRDRISDLLISRSRPPLAVQALLEELAHAGTGLLALAAFGIAVEGLVVLAVLGGSMPIDLDHPATSVFTGLLTEELGSVAPDQTQWVEQNQRGRSGAS